MPCPWCCAQAPTNGGPRCDWCLHQHELPQHGAEISDVTGRASRKKKRCRPKQEEVAA